VRFYFSFWFVILYGLVKHDVSLAKNQFHQLTHSSELNQSHPPARSFGAVEVAHMSNMGFSHWTLLMFCNAVMSLINR